MTVRIGVLGAAKISQNALFAPAADTDGVEVHAIAARSRERAEAQASEVGIPVVHDSYEALLADDEVDAVYNPLPISLHKEWTIAALDAGKHVLCEKPFASNAEEAREMVAAGQRCERELMEAFHWRYHPLAARISEIVHGGELGRLLYVDSGFTVPVPEDDDVRQSWELSGGALMDLGCYPVQWVRFVMGEEPRVVSASMDQGRPNVDVRTDIELETSTGVTGQVHTAMTLDRGVVAWLTVQGIDGAMMVENPIAPHRGHRIELTFDDETTHEDVEGLTTYHYQLEAFRDAIVDGAPFPTGGQDAIANMELIDAAYRAAGLPVRGT